MKYINLIIVWLCLVGGLNAQVQFNIVGGNVVQNGNYLVLNNASISNAGTFSASDGTVSFQGDGTDAVSTIGGTSIITFNILQINKSANNVLLEQSVNINNSLSLSNGLLDIQTYNLTLQTGAGTTGAGTNTYVKTSSTGFLIYDFPGIGIDIAFPVGQSTYNPLTINNAGTDDAFSVRVRDEVLDGGITGNAITENFVDRTWTVEEGTNNGSNITMTAQWNADEELTDFNRDDCYISGYNNGWSNEAFQMASGNDPYMVSRSGITDLTEFTVSSEVICPFITTLSEVSDICAGSTISLSATGLSNMSSSQNFVENYGIRFVAFSGTIPPTDPYIGGEDLGMISNAELTGNHPDQTATLPDAGGSLTAGEYLIYAVLYPTPEDEECKFSTFIDLLVQEAAAFTAQPSGVTFCIGDDYTLSVTATGTELSYQWKKDGVIINGATSATLELTDLQASDVGSYTLEATNLCGTLTSNAAVIIVENTAPTLSNCPSYPNPISTDTGQCYATISFTAPTVSDNCLIDATEAEIRDSDNNVITAYTTNPDGQFAPGTYSITWKATDSAGNTSSCSAASFSIEDDEAPIASCISSFTATLIESSATISTDDIDAGSTDNCTIVSYSLSESTFDCSDIGTFDVTLTVTDNSGNATTCITSLTIEDNTPPMAICNDFSVQLDMNGSATITTSDINGGSSDVCGISTLALDNNTFDCEDIGGSHTVTLTATDVGGNTSTCTSTVTVEDNNILNAQCMASIDFALTSDGTTVLTPDDIDNGSFNICGDFTSSLSQTDFDCDDVNEAITVTLTITNDDNNLSSSCQTTVNVIDPNVYCCLLPVALCNDLTVQLDANGMGSTTAAAVGAGSLADCGLLSESITQESFDCLDIGSHTVTYTITDINNVSANCTATITVEDNIAPVALCFNTTVEIGADGTYDLQEADVYDIINSSDNCQITQISFPTTTFTCDEVGASFTIPVTAMDASNNTGNCTANIQVILGGDLPADWAASDIGEVSMGNAYVFDPCTDIDPDNGAFTITGSGNNATSSTTDNIAFAYQTLCGDGSITAKIENVTPNGYGGLMIRETTDPGAKQVSLFSDLSNTLRHEVRYTTNGAKQISSFFKPAAYWLRLERQGDWIYAYYSTTGTSFTYVHAVFLSMEDCIEIGLASFTYLPNAQTETVFSNVSITGNIQTSVETTPFESNNGTNQLQDVLIFPNPTARDFTLRLTHAVVQPTRLQIHNDLGQLIAEKMLEAGTSELIWDVNEMVPGNYWLTIDDKNLSQKVHPVIIIR